MSCSQSIVEDFIADNVENFSQTQPPIKQRLKRYGREQKVDFWTTQWRLMLQNNPISNPDSKQGGKLFTRIFQTVVNWLCNNNNNKK